MNDITDISKDKTGQVKLIYVLYLASLLLGITGLVGLVMAYVYRENNGGIEESHFRYQIRTFWIGLLYSLVCAPLLLIPLLGMLPYLLITIWFIWRAIKGLKLASAGQPVSNPASWLV
ncbi:DUF4870 family protein [Marinobacterium arenosum]|uniref:DUF4870 family protein n=1 Tax=Marinobacterium arenosum TaxID=2862496 RepID=UPI001C96CC2B|nr:hypothetical protein [Marinobacterium arenosum]MBY4678047.1 hypothetical protein [Marinobacterium arenosum]